MDWFKCLPSSSWYSCKWLKAFLTAAAQQQPFTSVLKQKPGFPACRLFPALEKVLCTCAALHVAGVVPLFELSLSVRVSQPVSRRLGRNPPPVLSVPEPRPGSAAQWISCSVGERAPHRYLRLHQTSKQAAVKRQETGKRVIQGRRTQTQGVSWPSVSH